MKPLILAAICLLGVITAISAERIADAIDFQSKILTCLQARHDNDEPLKAWCEKNLK